MSRLQALRDCLLYTSVSGVVVKGKLAQGKEVE